MTEEISLTGRRIAVTGAGGFIGQAITRALSDIGAEPLAIDINAQALARLGPEVEARIADVTDPEAVKAALTGADLIVHTAAIVSDDGSMAEHCRVNVGGTANVLSAAATLGVSRVLHLSSVAVFGYETANPANDDATPRVCGVPYVDSKSAADRLARRSGAVVLRPGDVFGPGSQPWTVRPALLLRAGLLSLPRGRPCVMLPVYVDDLVSAAVTVLARGKPGRAYTAFDDSRPRSFGDLFDGYASLTNRGPIRRLPAAAIIAAGLGEELASRLRGRPPRATRQSLSLIDRRGRVDAGRIRDELGWKPTVEFDQAMRRTATWLRETGLL